jgi:beta-xylosidase
VTAHRMFAGTAAVVAGWLGMIGVAAMPAYAVTPAASSTFQAPVYGGDFPDPSVLPVGGVYWAYSTGSAGRNLQVMSSTDLHTWSPPTDPLPTLPGWGSAGRTWAPGVIERSGTLVMYYTVHDKTLNQQCISMATATAASPAGPFVDKSGGPLICQVANGGSIDPNPYLDPVSGRLYLLWKSDDNSLGHPTHIWAQQLTSDGRRLAWGSRPSLLLTESATWQSPAVEGPTMIRNGGLYYLFYGANNYDTANSGIGYATSSSLVGTFADQSPTAPWLGTTGGAQGPQGPMVFNDTSGATRMAFAAWFGTVGYENGGVRSLWIGSLAFNPSGVPTLS